MIPKNDQLMTITMDWSKESIKETSSLYQWASVKIFFYRRRIKNRNRRALRQYVDQKREWENRSFVTSKRGSGSKYATQNGVIP